MRGGRRNGGSLVALAIGLLVLAGAATMVYSLMSGTRREAEVKIQGDKIVITGQYGVTYRLADLEDVRLADSLPSVGRKVNGAGLGAVRKGDYEVAGYGTARLFIHSQTGPYLYLKVGGKWTILNSADPRKTVGIHDRIRDSWSAP